jgi:quercetin dioxygenase-like cupin family protein
MSRILAVFCVSSLAVPLFAACSTTDGANVGEAQQAVTAAPTSSLIGRGNYDGPIKAFRKESPASDWKAKIEVDPNMMVAVQTIDFPVGSQSTWHFHPGPVFITVKQGTMTFYRADDPSCTPRVLTAGQGFVDGADAVPHIARNESGAPATNVVVYFAPQGAALRTDVPDPGNCQF